MVLGYPWGTQKIWKFLEVHLAIFSHIAQHLPFWFGMCKYICHHNDPILVCLDQNINFTVLLDCIEIGIAETVTTGQMTVATVRTPTEENMDFLHMMCAGILSQVHCDDKCACARLETSYI